MTSIAPKDDEDKISTFVSRVSPGESSDHQGPAEVITPEKRTQPPVTTRIKGIALVVLTSIAATTQGACVKYLKDLPTGMIIIFVAMNTFCLFCVLVTHQGVSLTNFPMKRRVAVRIAFGSVVYVCQLWSFKHLAVGDASALVSTSPLFTCIVARIFLKEKFTPVTMTALFAGIAGVILIAKPSFIFKTDAAEFPWYYTLVPLLSAFTFSIVHVMQRTIAAHVNSVTLSFYIAVAQVIAGVAWQVISGDEYSLPPCFISRVLIFICALCLLTMFVAQNLAMKYETATTASIVRNLDTALGFIVQVAIFGVAAEVLSLVGAALIMAGTIGLALSKIFNITWGFKL